MAIEVCAEAFRRLAAGEAENVPRSRAQSPGIILHSMSAAAGYLGLVGWKYYTTTRKRAHFHLGLYDATGAMVALVEADRLGQLRTGAATGVAAEAMALPDATEVGLFGAGWQAQTQLEAIARVRYKALPEQTVQNHWSVATASPCCTFCTGRRTDFEVTPIRPTIAIQDHLSESRLRSM